MKPACESQHPDSAEHPGESLTFWWRHKWSWQASSFHEGEKQTFILLILSIIIIIYCVCSCMCLGACTFVNAKSWWHPVSLSFTCFFFFKLIKSLLVLEGGVCAVCVGMEDNLKSYFPSPCDFLEFSSGCRAWWQMPLLSCWPLHLTFWGGVSQETWGSPIQLNYLANELQGSICLHFPINGIPTAHHCTQLLHRSHTQVGPHTWAEDAKSIKLSPTTTPHTLWFWVLYLIVKSSY